MVSRRSRSESSLERCGAESDASGSITKMKRMVAQASRMQAQRSR